MANQIKLSLKEETTLPVCSSCGKTIHPKEKAASFYCPNCGEVMIWRDSMCRKQGVSYVCPNCGFEGV